jgi:SET domain-containing protein
LKTSKWIGLLIGIVALTLGFGGSVGAQTKNPCAEDAAKLCKDVKPGGGRLAKCLKEHEKDLSPQCKESMEAARAKAKEAHETCTDDVQKLCKDVKPGAGRIVQCLRENEKQLSPECREKLTQKRTKAQ